jgi:vacuolar-type H+-ATPase subunit I/STV1
MYDLIQTGQRIVSLLESHDEEIVRSEYDLIHKSSPKTIYRTLSSDYTYTITGFASSDRINDLDIVIYKKVNGEWVEETRDVESDATPVVSVKPSYTREYKIVVKAYSWKGGNEVSCYGLIVSHN